MFNCEIMWVADEDNDNSGSGRNSGSDKNYRNSGRDSDSHDSGSSDPQHASAADHISASMAQPSSNSPDSQSRQREFLQKAGRGIQGK